MPRAAMTPRERMLIAMRNGKPDRVPVAPDISNMIPCRLTGRPFWDIYHFGNPPLWRAYLDAVRYFGFDGWFIYAELGPDKRSRVDTRWEIVKRLPDRLVTRRIYRTPDGDGWEEWVLPIADSETCTVKMIKDLERDWPLVKWLYSDDMECDRVPFDEMKRAVGDIAAFGASVITPMLPYHLLGGELEAASSLYYEQPERMEEYRELVHRYSVRQTELFLDAGVDFVLIGASGTLALQSPEIFRHLGLPTMQAITKMCRQAGVPSMLHSCGKERLLVEIAANETELDCINPLEPPPGGDCDLREIKEKLGQRLALMGNLSTTELMLRGTAAEVEAAARQAILDAGSGGGFILSTGDQCGRDTPDENIRAMIRIAEAVGRY